MMKFFYLIFASILAFNHVSLLGFNENVRKDRLKPQDLPPSEQVPKQFEGVDIQERLGTFLDKSLSFTDEEGRTVTVEELLSSGKPIVVTLNYYGCTTLCAIQLNNLARLQDKLGEKYLKSYKLVTLSFDPKDTFEQAKERKDAYMPLIEKKENMDWTFLVGDEKNIKAFTDSIGFYYKFDEDTGEFAHLAGAFVLSPSGKVSRYLYGLAYDPRDYKFALIEASENKIGSTTDRILLNCFHYNPGTGKYDAYAFGILRVVALLTLILLVLVIVYFVRREKRKSHNNNK